MESRGLGRALRLNAARWGPRGLPRDGCTRIPPRYDAPGQGLHRAPSISATHTSPTVLICHVFWLLTLSFSSCEMGTVLPSPGFITASRFMAQAGLVTASRGVLTHCSLSLCLLGGHSLSFRAWALLELSVLCMGLGASPAWPGRAAPGCFPSSNASLMQSLHPGTTAVIVQCCPPPALPRQGGASKCLVLAGQSTGRSNLPWPLGRGEGDMHPPPCTTGSLQQLIHPVTLACICITAEPLSCLRAPTAGKVELFRRARLCTQDLAA